MHLDAEALFRAHSGFVASFLCRLGVPRSALDDAVQEVFLVAHRRGGFDESGPARPTTWLAEIAIRIAQAGRARAKKYDRESAIELADDAVSSAPSPFQALSTAESLAMVERALEGMSLEHRAVFVLYEIEEEACEDIARGLSVPIGTVHSRLYHARTEFQKAFQRLELTRGAGPVARSGGQR